MDYSLVGTSRVEPLLRDIRNAMYAAGLTVESAKGECNLGQHEIAFKYEEVVRTADQHAVYKTAAKEIASQHGKSLTFMAKYDEREGNSCHVHMSVRGTDGEIVFDRGDGETVVFHRFVAGVLATLRRLHAVLRAERQLLQAIPAWLVRADGDRLGPRQPHLRPSSRRTRCLACASRTGFRR